MTHTHHSEPDFDVVVVGGGAAGLAAALQLSRSRRRVVVVDAGEPRNAPADHMHSYLGHDGLPPGDLLALGRTEVRSYDGELRDGVVVGLTGDVDNGFTVALADGSELTARRILLAMGLADELPEIPGVREQWGRGVIHCPYCHGWEVRDQRIVVLGTGPMTTHQALLFRQLSDRVTVTLTGRDLLDEENRRRLVHRGVEIIESAAVEVVSEADMVRGVRLADGRLLDADAVVVAPVFRARVGPAAALGVSVAPTPMGNGETVVADARGLTSVPGVYAAGNVSDASAQVIAAAAQGNLVGAAINADLVMAEADRAVAGPGDSAADWDARYAQTRRRWSGHPNNTLVAEVSGLTPGTALDIGCGEGADALWLAEQGWKVTALDISQVALDRARVSAETSGLSIDWQQKDLTKERADGRYDLVSFHYSALRKDPSHRAITAMIDAVAPGGYLLVVGHSPHGHLGRRNGFNPDDYVQPPDVAERLGADWTAEKLETRARVMPPEYTGPDVPDVVLLARRR